MSWTTRSWLVTAAIVAPMVLVTSFVRVQYPPSVGWVCIALAGLVGWAIFIRPDLASLKSPTMARALGTLIVIAALVGAYAQFTQIRPE